MTVSQVISTRNATNIAIWLEAGYDEQQGLADLRNRFGSNDFVAGITTGNASVVVREVREDGRLGPAVPLFSATAGQLLLVPAGVAGVRVFLHGDRELQAVLLDSDSDMDPPVEILEAMLEGAFNDQQNLADWIATLPTDSGSVAWPVLISALCDKARLQARRASEEDREAFAARLERSSELDDRMLTEAVRYASKAARTGTETRRVTGINPLDTACRLIAAALDSPVPDRVQYKKDSPVSLLEQFSRAAHINRRSVLLQGTWWQEEAGPLLAFRLEDDAPVALLPVKKGYEAHRMRSGGTEVTPVDASFAKTLKPRVEMFYASLPARKLGLRDIGRFVVRGNSRDAAVVLLTTIVTAGLVALVPVLTGTIVNWMIPQGAVSSLVFIGILLLGIAIGRAILHVSAGFAFLRIETRSSFSLMAAFVDRLLQLPASFFRNHSTGDLTQRVMAIQKVRTMLTQSVLSIGMSFFAGLANLVVLFAYDFAMAIWGVGLAVVQLLMIGGISVYMARFNYTMSVEKGRLNGVAYDLIKGVRQARVQGSLARVLARITTQLVPVGRASYRLGIAASFNQAVLVGFQGLTLALVFVVYTAKLKESPGAAGMTDGDFVVFITALTAFFGATAMLGPAIQAIAEALPQYKRLKPIMEMVPEVSGPEREARHIAGNISLRDVTFRYQADAPLVLDGISLDIRQGEFIAFVGRTGCGKSTLVRLILGLDEPESGAVLFDGTPLTNIDPSVVRSQLGVVMQSNALLPGDVRSTILGVGTDGTLDDAWDAARLVGMEEEINAMPMGMLTAVWSGALSASQSQRLLIARALVRRPSVLILDEATSSLDNRTQQEISESIERLAATRIAIAHRLSTIRNADRIYVLASGKIVQSGSFEELTETDGHFRDLMAGQMT
jgi:NHLM bacteriocin system ABC transporter ATP-binding protein